jgi:hypothetical protein
LIGLSLLPIQAYSNRIFDFSETLAEAGLSKIEKGRGNAFLTRESDVQGCPYLFPWDG